MVTNFVKAKCVWVFYTWLCSVLARCKKWDVPIEKVYNKTQREKFAWAIDMADEDFRFTDYNDKYSGKDNGGGDEEEEEDDDESQDE